MNERNTAYFVGDNADRTVSPSSLTAFGIFLDSRNGRASEIKEMLAFAEKLANSFLNSLVESVFYDSNSCTCYYTFSSEFDSLGGKAQQFAAAQCILDCAKRTLTQFEYDETIYHGVVCDCTDCRKEKVASLSEWRKRKESYK